MWKTWPVRDLILTPIVSPQRRDRHTGDFAFWASTVETMMTIIQGRFRRQTTATPEGPRDSTLFGLLYEGILRRWQHHRGDCEFAAAHYVQQLRADRTNEEAWRILREEIAMLLLTHSGDDARRFYEQMRTLVEAAAKR